MNLDDKLTIPMPPGEPPAGSPQSPTSKSAKRRKNGGANGSASRKSRKAGEDEELVDNAATLTMSSGQGEGRRKKMLFEPVDDDQPAPTFGVGQRDVASTTFASTVSPVAVPEPEPVVQAEPEPAVANPAPAPLTEQGPETEPAAAATSSTASEAPEGPAPETESTTATRSEPMPEPAPIADTKGAVFQVATLVMRSAESDTDGMETDAASEPQPAAADTPGEEPAVESTIPADSVPAVETAPEPMPPIMEPVAEPILLAADVAPISAAASAPLTSPAAEATAARQPMSRSEAIAARAARMSALNGARSTAQTSQPAHQVSRAQEQRSTELPVHPGDIYGYWTRIKNGRRFPSRSDFDAEQVAEHWPNSMLLTCDRQGGSFSSVLRLGANLRSRPGEDLSFTSMMTEWILSIGGEAARAGKPVQDTEVFPTPDGTHAYKIVALPLSDHQTRVDHVLCHLSRS
jgi:hypothetical protein